MDSWFRLKDSVNASSMLQMELKQLRDASSTVGSSAWHVEQCLKGGDSTIIPEVDLRRQLRASYALNSTVCSSIIVAVPPVELPPTVSPSLSPSTVLSGGDLIGHSLETTAPKPTSCPKELPKPAESTNDQDELKFSISIDGLSGEKCSAIAVQELQKEFDNTISNQIRLLYGNSFSLETGIGQPPPPQASSNRRRSLRRLDDDDYGSLRRNLRYVFLYIGRGRCCKFLICSEVYLSLFALAIS